MFVEFLGYPLEPQEFEDGLLLDLSSVQFDPVLVNTENVTFVCPADDPSHALVFTLDGAVIMSHDPYNYVKGLIKDDRMTIRLDRN